MIGMLTMIIALRRNHVSQLRARQNPGSRDGRKFVLRQQSSSSSHAGAALFWEVLRATKSRCNDTPRGRPPARAARYVYISMLLLRTVNCLPSLPSGNEALDHPRRETRPDDPVPPKMGLQSHQEPQEDVSGLRREFPGRTNSS